MSSFLSRRAAAVPASPIRKLTPFAEDAKRRGIRIYHLNIGQPDLETPPEIRDRLAKIDTRVIEYSPSAGTRAFLESMQRYYADTGIPVRLEEILATTGGSEALLFAMMAVADPGEEIVVVEPFYTNYANFAAMSGVRLVPVTSTVDDGFHLPPRAAWERAITERTRAILICNPNNPTGTAYTRAEVLDLADLCRERNLVLISDEVYREFVYDGRERFSALTLDEIADRVIVIDSLSKRYSACGIRLGAMITRNRDVYAAALRMAQGRLSPPGIAQMIAIGIRDIGARYIERVVAEYQERRDFLFERLSAIEGVVLHKPEGAFYFVAKLPVSDADDFCRWLLTSFTRDGATVMLAPASGFYLTPGLGRDEVRVAYVLKKEDLRHAVEILSEALDRYREAHEEAPVTVGAEDDADFDVPPES